MGLRACAVAGSLVVIAGCGEQAATTGGAGGATAGSSVTASSAASAGGGATCAPLSDDGFYRTPLPPETQRGELVACETYGDPPRTLRFLYVTEGAGGALVPASALLRWPARAKTGGHPVVAWAHGTTGTADACAPSKDPSGFAVSYVTPFVDAGYALLMPDYQGLGTPGPHPYLIGEAEGHSVWDALAAARHLGSAALGGATLAAATFLAGHSQGGHAALFARKQAALSTARSGTDLKGTIAYAPGLSTPRSTTLVASDARAPLWGAAPFMALFFYEAALYHADAKPADFFRPPFDVEVPKHAESDCILAFAGFLGSAATKVGELFTDAFVQAMKSCTYDDLTCPAGDPYWRWLVASEPGREAGAGPLLVVQGQVDTLVVPLATGCLVERMAAVEGAAPEVCNLAKADHIYVVSQSFSQVLAWMGARLGGRTPPPLACDGPALPACGAAVP
jgi:hypothetical protein